MPILLQSEASDKGVTLSARLSAIAESLPKDCLVCDVGSDHGFLPLYLLSHKLCNKVIVTDLNEKPLARAKHNLQAACVDENALFVRTDGIEEVLQYSPDVFVIAGMGGETILGILERALSFIPVGTQFVLQPMTKVPALRRFLYEFGFLIFEEKVIFENGKYFNIISTKFDGISRKGMDRFYEYGEFLPHIKTPLIKNYFSGLLTSLDSVIEEKKKGGACSDDQEISRRKLLEILEGLNEDQRY